MRSGSTPPGLPTGCPAMGGARARAAGDPDTDRYWRPNSLQAMEDRQRRLGEHAAEHTAMGGSPGPVPEHPVDRGGWEHKAGLVAAYREMWGQAHPYEPIGVRPTRNGGPAR